MESYNVVRSLSTAFVLVVSALILLYLYLKRKFGYWRKRGIKSPTSFLESLRCFFFSFNQPSPEATISAYKKYGRLFGIYSPFPHLWIAEPNLLKQILVKDFNVFHNRIKMDSGEEIIDKMIFMLCDEDWKRVRCIFSPTFSSGKMRKMAILVKECSSNVTKSFQTLVDKEENCDIKQHFASFAVDVIATAAFATKIKSLDDPDNEFIANARKLSNRDFNPLSSFIALMFPRIAKWLNIELFPSDSLSYYKRLVMKITEEREKTKMKGHDFLQLMLDAKAGSIEESIEDPESNRNEVFHTENLPKHKTMTMEEVISQCIMFFFAGHDTTTASLSNVAYHLALNPEYQEKLVNEIQVTWEKHGEFDFDVVSKMTYLDAVLCESLRLSAPVTTLMRLCDEDYTLGDTGTTISEGTIIIIPIYAMHHDPEWFPDPEKFNPERFLPENKHLIKPFTYLPFGDGPRNCIGMRFVMMAMKLCLCYLLREVKFVATDETRKPIKYYFGQGVTQAKRIPMRIEKR